MAADGREQEAGPAPRVPEDPIGVPVPRGLAATHHGGRERSQPASGASTRRAEAWAATGQAAP